MTDLQTPPTLVGGYLDRLVGEILKDEAPVTIEVYFADGPLAGDTGSLPRESTSHHHEFFDNRGVHRVLYWMVQQHSTIFDGTAFEISLVWDTLYCARDPDFSDAGNTNPRVEMVRKDPPDRHTNFQLWWDWQAMAIGFETFSTLDEWDEFESLCSLNLASVLGLHDEKVKESRL